MGAITTRVLMTPDERLVEIYDGETNVAVVAGSPEQPVVELYGQEGGRPWTIGLAELTEVLRRAAERL